MLGLIVEYNPFHNGHLIHINKSIEISKSSKVICVMSGNFVQRGEMAVLNKHIRTKMALLNGVDIVLELPLVFATGSADLFALGAIDLLNKTNIVNKICFGSENGNLKDFEEIVNILAIEPKKFKENLKNELSSGICYPLARKKALEKVLKKEIDFIKTPNNILGLEYLIGLKKTNSKITPYTIKREKTGYYSNKINNKITSATGVRKFLSENKLDLVKEVIPNNCFKILEELSPFNVKDINMYSEVLNFILRTKPASELRKIADITEGLENRMLKNIETNNFLITDFINKIKTKRYTYAKLQKAVMHIILEITKKEQETIIKDGINQYIRVLGFRRESTDLIKSLCKKAKVPVVMNINKDIKNLNPKAKKILNKEIKATDIFYFNTKVGLKRELKEPIVIV